MGSLAFTHLEQGPVSGRAALAVIILHGYGSTASRSMAQAAWITGAFPDAHIFAPEGTFPFVGLLDPKSPDMSSEPSQERRVWYHRYSEESRQQGLATTREKLDVYIDECAATAGLSRDQVAVIGISQGAITVLNCVPLFERPLGAAIAHSGYLFSPDSLALRRRQLSEFRSSAIGRTPICSIHGLADYTLPWQTHLEAATLLDELGVETEFHLLSGLKHADFESRSQAITTEFIRRKLRL